MSWRQRAGGPTTTPLRPRQTNHPVYEDFDPKIDTNERQEARIVVLHVPGFLKEQMKITAEQSGNIRVQGQRPLLNNKWIRFNQILLIPTSCEANKIHAKFSNGLLTITMPKEVLKTEKPVEKTTQENVSGSPPTKPVVPPPAVSEPTTKRAAVGAEQRAQKGHEKPTQTTPSVEKKTGYEEHKVEKSPQKADLAAEREAKKIGSATTPMTPNLKSEKEIGKPNSQRVEETIKQLDLAAIPQKPFSSTEPKAQKVQEIISTSTQSNEEKARGEKIEKPQKIEKVVEKSSSKKTQEDPEKAVPGAVENAKKPKDDDGDTLGIKKITETAKQSMSNVMKKLNEDDRQLLINIGAAVMVLVALGAYISLGNFGSSTENGS